MFQIREEHVSAFQKVAVDNFEERAVRHLRTDLAEHTAGCSDGDLRARVRECIPRAAAYDLNTERQVIFFVDTTYLAGVGFDTDPACPWAQRLLSSRLSADEKASSLMATALALVHQAKVKKGLK